MSTLELPLQVRYRQRLSVRAVFFDIMQAAILAVACRVRLRLAQDGFGGDVFFIVILLVGLSTVVGSELDRVGGSHPGLFDFPSLPVVK